MNTLKGLPQGWEIRQGLNGRLYYYSKQSQTVQILPPPEVWRCAHSLPYGWEMAIDYENKNYYVNHITQTVTYEDPRTEDDQTSPNEIQPTAEAAISPQPRECEIVRDSEMGFGFIAGSEKPVVIRSVTAGGPSEGKVLPGDQIVKIGSENVMMADRERVIELIRMKSDSVVLTVLQPNRSASSSFLNPTKKTFRTMDRPKVRFSEDVVVSGQERTEGSSPLLVSPGVLRVELENKQTRSFRFQTETTAGDAVAALCDKLGFKDPNLFSLVLTPPVDAGNQNGKNGKSFFRVSTASDPPSYSGASQDSLLIAPWDCLAKVVSNPLIRHHSCFFRLEFMPKDFYKLARNDPDAFQYLYQQCINDVVSGDAYKDDLSREELVKLAVIQMQELVLTSMPSTPPDKVQKRYSSSSEIPIQRNAFRFSGISNKLTLKHIEKEYGLKRFLPHSVLSIMQKDNPTGRSIRKSLQQYLKASYSTSFFSQHPTSPIIPTSPILTAGGNADAAIFQLRLQYLKILSPQHLFGGRYFFASMQALMESDITILVGHNYGISQMINAKTRMVSVLAEFQQVTGFEVAPNQVGSNTTTVRIQFAEKKELVLTMEPQAAHNFAFMVAGYCRVYGNIDMVLTLPMEASTTAPIYFGPHKVKPSHWNYPPDDSIKGSFTDLPLPHDLATASPSYFYCDFSEPLTPALLSQQTPNLHIPTKNGLHRPPTPPPVLYHPIDEEDGLEADDDIPVFHDHKPDTSDSNNNNSFHTSAHDVMYEEIHPPSESPVSSLSAGQYSDLSPSSSLPNARDEIPTLNGYLVPTPPEQRQRKAMGDEDDAKRVDSDGDNDWMDLMKALGKNKEDGDGVDGVKSKAVPDLPSTAPPVKKNDIDDAVQEIVVPPPPCYPPPKRKESLRKEGDKVLEKSKSLDPKYLLGSSTPKTSEESTKFNTVDTRTPVPAKESPNTPHMSSFKPSDAELNVFALTRNDPRATSPTVSKPSSAVPTPEKKPLGSMDDVQDPATRKKLQETDDLIEYFRRRREEVVGSPSADDGPAKPRSNFDSSIEFDSPIVVSDIAAGNKRLRKAEKAASKNRKSWAASDSLSRKMSLEDQGPISMSNPDLATSSMPKKRSKSLFRRLFGDRRRRSRSMYETSGTSSAYGRRKKRFRIPRFRFRRAFSTSSAKKDNRKTVIPTAEEETPSKSGHFRFRPFSSSKKELRSPGVLVISEPCDDVRGIDLLPSGKYTVAGTMFQANGDARETEIITLESTRPSRESLVEKNQVSETSNDSEASGVKKRTGCTRDSQRPFSFPAFHKAGADIINAYDNSSEPEPQLTTVAEAIGTSLPDGLDQASPCELSLTESSEALQEIARGLEEKERRSRNDTGDVSVARVLGQNKPARKLLPVENPIVPTKTLEGEASPRSNAELNSGEPQATSTPIQITEKKEVKRRPSNKRPAPPPPVKEREPIPGKTVDAIDEVKERDSREEGEDSKSDWDEDSLFKRNGVESPSLVTEIMSYLNSGSVTHAEAEKVNEMERDVLEEHVLPYDEGYMMPGIKSAKDVRVHGMQQLEDGYENGSEDEKTQKKMYEMFYHEMMADDSRLSLNRESSSSEDEVEPDSDDSENEGHSFGSYDVTHENDTTDGDVEKESIVLRSYGAVEEESTWTTDKHGSMTSPRNESSDIGTHKDSSSTSGSESSYVNIQKPPVPVSENVQSQHGGRKQYMGNYVAYQNLISPSGFSKPFPGAKRTPFIKKPPLPPKPIFH